MKITKNSVVKFDVNKLRVDVRGRIIVQKVVL